MVLTKKIYISALLGVFLEYFDYTLYGFSAPFIGSYFFSNENPKIALVLSWAIFSAGFLVRPLGAILFGHWADRFGRKAVLMFTIFLMSLATTAIGLLPSYAKLGALAPICLLACRILQGLSASTEYSGCSTYLLELARNRQGLISGIVTSASGFGVCAASLVVLIFSAHWQLSFIISGLLVGVLGSYLRRNLTESPCFLTVQRQSKIARIPLLKLFKDFPKHLTLGISLSAYTGISIILIEIYLPSYLQLHLAVSKENALRFSTYLALLEACLAIFWGYTSDYLGRLNMIKISGILMILSVFPAFKLLHQAHILAWAISAILLANALAAIDGPIAAFLASSFPTEIRYTGVSLSYTVGAAVVGGITPAIVELIQSNFQVTELPIWYLLISAILMLIILRLYQNKLNLYTSRDSLNEYISD